MELSKLRQKLGKMLYNLSEIKTADDKIIFHSGELELGSEFKRIENSKFVPLEDGEYQLECQITIKIENGKMVMGTEEVTSTEEVTDETKVDEVEVEQTVEETVEETTTEEEVVEEEPKADETTEEEPQPETVELSLTAHQELLQEIADLKAKVTELENAEPIKKIDNKFNKQEKTEKVGISRYTQYLNK